MIPESIGSPGLWPNFVVFVIAVVAIDLGIFHRKAHVVAFREALAWSSVWVSLALLGASVAASLWVSRREAFRVHVA